MVSADMRKNGGIMYYRILMLKWKLLRRMKEMGAYCLSQKSYGIDGLLVTVGLCIIALLLCIVMKDKLAAFIETIVTSLTNKATGILGGT